jgi:hypothetical protein
MWCGIWDIRREEKRDVFYVNVMKGWAGLINLVQNRD